MVLGNFSTTFVLKSMERSPIEKTIAEEARPIKHIRRRSVSFMKMKAARAPRAKSPSTKEIRMNIFKGL